MEEIRLQKYLADQGVCSRRAAEKEIEAGNVRVNGQIASIGDKVCPGRDRVEYRGRNIARRAGSHPVYIMLHKPAGYVTTLSDEKGRKTVADLVSDIRARIYPVGRLDMDSEGLLILTNDGNLTNALTHPRHHIPKYYRVRVAEDVTKECLAKLSGEMTIDGFAIQPVECAVIDKSETGTTLSMILYEGRNRQIRKMCEQCGLTVKHLKRVAIGDLELDVPKGKWRYLSKREVDSLKQACGLISKNG